MKIAKLAALAALLISFTQALLKDMQFCCIIVNDCFLGLEKREQSMTLYCCVLQPNECKAPVRLIFYSG